MRAAVSDSLASSLNAAAFFELWTGLGADDDDDTLPAFGAFAVPAAEDAALSLAGRLGLALVFSVGPDVLETTGSGDDFELAALDGVGGSFADDAASGCSNLTAPLAVSP